MSETTAEENSFSETAGPDQIECQCHDCRSLYEESVLPTHKVLEIRSDNAVFLDDIESDPRMRGFTFPQNVKTEFIVLGAKLRRVKRIAANYAQAFLDIERLGVDIPFPGVAAFAANIVHNELENAMREYASVQLDEMNYDGNAIMQAIFKLNKLMLSPISIGEGALRSLIQNIIYGNLLVFVEVFPIYTFCIKHFQRFGVPRGEAIAEFETCLRDFITWWNQNNFGSGDAAFVDEDEKQRIEIDRENLFRRGIIAGLRGDRDDSALKIMENEQRFTLQEYMYDRIDTHFAEFLDGAWDLDDPFYIGAYFRNIALSFTYDLKQPDIAQKYVIPWTGGNVTEIEDRLVFTRLGVHAFISLYYGDDRDYIQTQINRIKRHINET